MFQNVQRLLAAGLSMLPIAADSSKSPAKGVLPITPGADGTEKHIWGVFQSRQPTVNELRSWFFCWPPCGVAIVCGAVSGGLEVIDIDNFDLADPWMKLVSEQNPTILARLVMVRTPRPGLHVYLRSPACGSSEALAKKYQPPDSGSEAPKLKTLIETKGEGGYVLAPGSPGYCHPTGRQYTYLLPDRDLTQIPTISVEERALLITAARTFNEVEKPAASIQRPHHRVREPNLALPADDFNARADWSDILTRNDWTLISVDADGKQNWCRPGKDWGVSATVNYAGNDLLHVFSSNAPHLEPGRSYNKFQFVTFVEYGGDSRTASWALRSAGYGQQATATTGHLRGRGRGKRRRHR